MGRRAKSRALGFADLRFSAGLLILAYGLTLAIWLAHREISHVLPGRSTSRVVLTGAAFGSLSAMSDAFVRAPRGRLWVALAWLVLAAGGYLGTRQMLGRPDGSVLKDAVPALAGFGAASVVCLGVLLVLSARGRRRARTDA